LQDPDHASNFPRAHHLRPSNNHLSAAIASFPPPYIANFLVKLFFKYSETHYFLVQESWVLSKVDLLYNNPDCFSHKGAEVTVAIVLSVFAIGTQYAHLESLGQASTSASGSTFSEDDVGATFYQHAIRLLPEIIEIASLESVQACLLFGYYALPVDASGLGFIYINLAMRLGMQNGMHRKCKNDAFTRSMVETRNRVWWTAYVLERYSLSTCKICTVFANVNSGRYLSFTVDLFRYFGRMWMQIFLSIKQFSSHKTTQKASLEQRSQFS
jgi:hypothetical protein